MLQVNVPIQGVTQVVRRTLCLCELFITFDAEYSQIMTSSRVLPETGLPVTGVHRSSLPIRFHRVSLYVVHTMERHPEFGFQSRPVESGHALRCYSRNRYTSFGV